ncbi:hypothetical protein RHS04_07403 [Rhizoctonia solani]|uniref:Uncharacterized protein n=1 Tax=Rhizoctonia solani TaxID=456999 RepID=A0A8H7LGM7_9AGAM|nr:hypothetical protein RHS04_07403 [Rhizoctonia solani]
MQTLKLAIFIWSANLALASPPSVQYNTAGDDPPSVGSPSGTDITVNFYGPVDVHYHHHHPTQFYDQFGKALGQLVLSLWTCCVLGLLYALTNAYRVRTRSRAHVTGESEDKSAHHLGGRTSAIVSCCELSLPHDPDKAEAHHPSAPETSASTNIQRGKKFASQGPSSQSRPTLVTSQNPWDIKEPYYTSYKRQVWMSPLVMEDVTTKDQEEKGFTGGESGNHTLSSGSSTSRYPVRLSPPRVKSKNQKGAFESAPGLQHVKSKRRLIPYLNLKDPGIKNRCRNSIPNIPTNDKPPLTTSLYGKSCFRRSTFIVWFILLVGVDDESNDSEFKDPEHDLEFWRKVLEDPDLESEFIRFAILAGSEATLQNIEKALDQLFHDSGALGIPGRTRIFVYFTGEGSGQNTMRLQNNLFLSKKDIDQWLWQLRATWGYSQTITLVFDICRVNKDEPFISMHDGVELICSCSPGQKAPALKFAEDTLYSSFMLAFLIASTVSSRSSIHKLKKDIEQRVVQMTEVGEMAALRQKIEPPGPQTPDWTCCHDGSTFLELAQMLSGSRIVRRVCNYITQLSYFPGKNISPDSTYDYGPLPSDRTTGHIRGASQHISVVPPSNIADHDQASHNGDLKCGALK